MSEFNEGGQIQELISAFDSNGSLKKLVEQIFHQVDESRSVNERLQILNNGGFGSGSVSPEQKKDRAELIEYYRDQLISNQK